MELSRSMSIGVLILLCSHVGPARSDWAPDRLPIPGIAGSTKTQHQDAAWELISGPVDSPPVSGHQVVHDPVRHRMVVLNGLAPHELWCLPLPASQARTWVRVPIQGSSLPPARWDFSAAYDSLRDRIVLFGGAYGENDFDDVWELVLSEPPHWSRVATVGDGPLGRSRHSAILDKARNRMVIFGGSRNFDYEGRRLFSDTWALSLDDTPHWVQLAKEGRQPKEREGASAVYDPWLDRMIVFGGLSQNEWGSKRVHGDSWSLPLSGGASWDSIEAPPGPAPRHGSIAVFDPVRRRLVVSGGDALRTNTAESDTWVLALERAPTWFPLTTSGSNPAVTGHAAIYSPEQGSLIQLGGTEASNGSQCYELDLQARSWTRVEPGAPRRFPSRRSSAFTMVGTDRAGLIVYGGHSSSNDLWVFDDADGIGWTPLPTTGFAPGYLDWCIAHDSRGNRLLSFAGGSFSSRGDSINEVWALTLDEPRTWTRLPVDGSPPPGRARFSLMYDVKRDRVLLYGGHSFRAPNDWFGVVHDDVWSLDLRELRWTRLTPIGTSGGHAGHVAFYDARRDRMLISGHDTWALELSGDSLDWRVLGPPHPEPGSTALDFTRDRLILWPGGLGAWTLTLSSPSAWTSLRVTGEPPSGRSYSGTVYDPVGDRLLVHAGELWGGPFSTDLAADLHALRFSHEVGLNVVEGLAPFPLGTIQVAILGTASFSPDSVLVTTVTLGGAHAAEGHHRLRDVNRDGRRDLALGFPIESLHLVASEDSLTTLLGETPNFNIRGRVDLRLALRVPSPGHDSGLQLTGPNPAIRSLTVTYTLASSTVSARLEIYDVAGRRVMTRHLDSSTLGPHRLALDDRPLSPGLYFLRLVQGSRVKVSRSVLLP